MPAGFYYLDDDTSNKGSTKYTIKLQGDVTICLNGMKIEKVGDDKAPVFEVTNGYTLTLTDCRGGGKVTHSTMDKDGSGVYVNNGILNLYKGQITGNNGREQGEYNDRYGGGVYVNNGTFNMYGDAITENDANYGGGVYVNNGTFNMYGGTIKSNESSKGSGSGSGGAGVYMESGNFIMKNTASVIENEIGRESNGGGVYVKGGTFTMNNDASVADNKATYGNSCGGGVYVGGGTFEMHNNASVTKNIATGRSATLNGAGVYVTGRDTTFTMHDSASVTGNQAKNGGGVYVEESGKFEMNDTASVSSNTASGNTADQGDGGGVYVKSGTFTMKDKASVSDNQATNTEKNNTTYGGGVYVSNNGTFTMNGEETSVSNNTATNGGGVHVETDGKFNMNGKASVTNNIGNGVCVSNNAAFTVSGAPTVTGNTMNNDDSNVYLNGGAYITIGSFGLNSSANSIGVTKKEGVDYGVIAKNVSTDYSGKFFSDDETREVKYDETDKTNNRLVLKKKETQPSEHKHIWTYEANKATITATCTGEGNCDVNHSFVRITPPADLIYDGKDKHATVERSKNWEPAFPEIIVISYYKLDSGSYVEMVNEAPTKVGKYKASITVGGKTASVEYVILDGTTEKQDQEALHLASGKYTIAVGEKLTLTVTGGTGTGKVVYQALGDGSSAATIDGDVLTAVSAGKVTVTAVKNGDENFKDAVSNTITITITEKSGGTTPSQPGGSSSDSSDSYDSNPIIKTETKNNADGSTTKTETRKDGTVTATTTAKDGSTSKTETKKDGSSVTENKAADGSTGTVKTDKNGQTEAKTALSNKAVEDAKRNGEAVKAPVEVQASKNSSTAPTVKVELPKGAGETKVEIPVTNVKSGTVAVLVHPDGTEEIVKNSLPTENGIQLTVNGGATVKIIDNSKDFIDTRNHWAKDAIDFVSARELVNGISATRYAPDASATRAQLWTILARQNDADLTGGNTWYEKAQLWSKDKGISDGTQPDAAISRAQMVTMLWRASGSPAAQSGTAFQDVAAGSYYGDAVAWAVENGITAGVGGGRFDPDSICTRAQIATFLAQSMK